MKSVRRKKTRPGQRLGLLLGLFFALILILFRPGVFERFEKALLDERFQKRGPVPHSGVVVVIAITDKDLKAVGFEWPWSRLIYAEFFRSLRSPAVGIRPSAVLFDILLPDPRDEFDALFAEEIEEWDNLVLPFSFDAVSKEAGPPSQRSDGGPEDWDVPAKAVHHSLPAAARLNLPLEGFSEAADSLGFVNARKESDSVIRGAWTFCRHGDRLLPSLAMAGLMEHLEVSAEGVEVIPGRWAILDGRKGVVRIPVDESGALANINFRGKEAFLEPPDAVSFTWVLSCLGKILGESDLEQGETVEEVRSQLGILDGKILVLGMYAEGLDVGAVPTNSTYPLSALHANVLDNVLMGDYIRPGPTGLRFQEVLILLFFGLAVGAGVRILSPGRGGMVTALFLLLYFIIGFEAFFRFNWVLPLFRPSIVVLLTYTGHTLYYFIVERRAHKRAERFLSSYVSKNVASRLLDSGEDISFAGERAQITTMFADIRGFTSLSERLSPDEVVRTLNDYFGEMTEAIFENDGTLDKFMGDAIMVFFGHPDPQPDHALRAIRTAVAMQKKMEALQKRWTIEGRESIGIGIGINTGLAVVGNLGTDYKTEYTAIGDHVNVAFRIQGLAGPGEILVTDETYQYVDWIVDAEPREPVRVKGKSEPIKVYRVKELREK